MCFSCCNFCAVKWCYPNVNSFLFYYFKTKLFSSEQSRLFQRSSFCPYRVLLYQFYYLPFVKTQLITAACVTCFAGLVLPRLQDQENQIRKDGVMVQAPAAAQTVRQWGTFILTSPSYGADRWAERGHQIKTQQVHLERDEEPKRQVWTVGISEGQDFCSFVKEYRVKETVCGVCVCVCAYVPLYSLHTEDKTTHPTSKVGAFWLVPTTLKECWRVKTWFLMLRLELG